MLRRWGFDGNFKLEMLSMNPFSMQDIAVCGPRFRYRNGWLVAEQESPKIHGMSIRLEMIQVARLAPKALGESADLVAQFLKHARAKGGGFQDRSGSPDLYYTVFGLDGLLSLGVECDESDWLPFVTSHGTGEDLDFVHLCCLIRCLSAAQNLRGVREDLLSQLNRFRSQDGGFNPEPNAPYGTAYGAFLGVGAMQDLGVDLNHVQSDLQSSLDGLKTSDGAWGNDRQQKVGATNATAAVMTTLRQWGGPVPSGAADWLINRIHPMGGFMATPTAPIPDLLSTATALHALAGVERGVNEEQRERCLDFIDTLWTNEGAFHGHWHEDELDTEYTFYGLLALGHLNA